MALSVNLAQINSAARGNSDLRETLTGIHLTLAATGCSATIDGTGATGDNGSAVIHIHNSPSKLKLEAAGGSLHVYVGSGCTGLFKNGDAVTVTSAYLMSPAQTITESS